MIQSEQESEWDGLVLGLKKNNLDISVAFCYNIKMTKATKQDQFECPACKETGYDCEIWAAKGLYRSLSFVKCNGEYHFLDQFFSSDEKFRDWYSKLKKKK